MVSNTTALPLVLLILLRNRESVIVRQMIPIGIAGAIGAVLGGYVLVTADERALRISILVLIIIFTVITAANTQIRIPKPRATCPRVETSTMGTIVSEASSIEAILEDLHGSYPDEGEAFRSPE